MKKCAWIEYISEEDYELEKLEKKKEDDQLYQLEHQNETKKSQNKNEE